MKNRETKFRGKSIETGQWVYGDLWRREQDVHGTIGYLILYPDGRTEFVDGKTVGQFTGLFDKNNQPIYEGDIIKYKTFYYGKERDNLDVITWLNDEQTDLFGEPTFYGYLKTWGDCEILGNIYENTELLNDQSK